jgi:uncharacterized protein YbjT (DUF2867 family)
MILVVGATGVLGVEICRRLQAEGRPVRAMVRPTSDPCKVEALRALGAELVSGDLKDRRSLDTACHGVTAVISTATSTVSRQPGDTIQSVDLDGHLSLIDAARAAGVPRFIYISYAQRLDDVPCPLMDAMRAVEQHLMRSGLTYTIVRPTVMMETWLAPILGFDIQNAKAQLYGSGEGKISWVATGDVAQFVVASLDHPGADNAIVEVGGPEALSPREVVQLCEAIGGRRFEVQHVPADSLRAQYAAATDPLQRSFAALGLYLARGVQVDMRDTLRTFPIELTPVADHARRALSSGGGKR